MGDKGKPHPFRITKPSPTPAPKGFTSSQARTLETISFRAARIKSLKSGKAPRAAGSRLRNKGVRY